MVIVAAVDKSERAVDVLKQSKNLADAFGDTIHIVHVLTRSEFINMERTSVDKTGTTIDVDRVREVAADVATDAAADLNAQYECVGLVGDPADRIVEYAYKQDARYIVVSGRKRSPAGKMIFGSVTQSILLNAKSPVVSTITQPNK